MGTLAYSWPWLGLGLAVVMLLWLALRRMPGPWSARWRDPAWLFWLAWPIYMIHQFEEHGIDARGHHYAFQAALCATLGYPDTATGCPASSEFILAVNVGSVWIALGAGALAGVRRPGIGVAALGIPLVNAIAHVMPAIRTGTYNPGLVTGVVLFIPSSIWILRELVRQHVVKRGAVALAVASGVLVHAILLGSLLARDKGVIGDVALVAIQIANGLLVIALGRLAIARRA